MRHFTHPTSSPIGRREFLRRGGAGLAGVALLGWSDSARAGDVLTRLDFSFAPDDSGTLAMLLETFNREHEGEAHVSWQVMPRDTDAYFRRIRSDLMAASDAIDIIGADTIWTAEFAHNRWVHPIDDRFHDTYDTDLFLDATLDAATFDDQVWAVPWYTDAGLLFYRRDLLIRSDILEPPRTWRDLRSMATRIQHEQDVRHGYLFQGAEYEGGVANALEFIWNAGGAMMDRAPVADASAATGVSPETVVIDSDEAAQGLEVARSLIVDNVAPEAVTTYRERDCWEAFLQGDAVFMRNWPFVYGLIGNPEYSVLSPEQVGVAPLPSLSADHRPYSCLGGWNLMINGHMPEEKLEAAWDFIQFATSADWQRNLALQGGFLPSRQALYDDPAVVGAMPVIDLGADAIAQTRSRPVTPYYAEMSQRIARAFNHVLRDDQSGSEAVATLQRELTTIIEQHES